MADTKNLVLFGDNLEHLEKMPEESVQLIYIDPPFNTGRRQTRGKSTTTRTETGNRVGFKGQRYEIVRETVLGYDDEFADYWSFLEPRLEEAWRLLNQTGTLYLHAVSVVAVTKVNTRGATVAGVTGTGVVDEGGATPT